MSQEMSQPTDPRLSLTCGQCGVQCVRLYRPYPGGVRCAEDDRCNACVKPDSRGWMVPVFMDESGSVWGFLSVPDPVINWFYALPEANPQPGAVVWKRKGFEGQVHTGFGIAGQYDVNGWILDGDSLNQVMTLPGVDAVTWDGGKQTEPTLAVIRGDLGSTLEPVTIRALSADQVEATCLEARAVHKTAAVAVAAVLALGCHGDNDISRRADEYLERRGAVPTGLKWGVSCSPRSYITKIMHGEVRR